MGIFDNIFNKKKVEKDLDKNRMAFLGSNRTKGDIQKLRQAVKDAENGKLEYRTRYKMQELYQDTILDGHVQACINVRKNLTLKKQYAIVSEKGETDEKLTALLNEKWFYLVQNSILDALYFGYSLINWTGVQDNKLTGLQTIRRDLIQPDTNLLLPYQNASNGIDFVNSDVKNWSLYTDTFDNLGYSKCGYGLLYSVTPYAIAIRNNLGYNSDFVEKFIMPFVVAKSFKMEGEERDILEQGIANMASNNSVLLDPTDEIEFIESKNAGSGYNSFDNLENRCEKKISKIILGHADAIDSTSGKLGSNDEVKDALESLEVSDNRFVEYQINDVFFDKLRAIGFNIPLGYKFQFVNTHEKTEKLESESTVNQLFANVVKTLNEAGHYIDDKIIFEKTGLKTQKVVQPVSQSIKNLYD
jgi:phage gp29-like protein